MMQTLEGSTGVTKSFGCSGHAPLWASRYLTEPPFPADGGARLFGNCARAVGDHGPPRENRGRQDSAAASATTSAAVPTNENSLNANIFGPMNSRN